MAINRTARLAQWHIRLLSISGTVLWLSGIVWLLLHHFGQVAGEFGPETTPFEPWMMRLHGLALIFALLGFGGLFVAHMPMGWNNRQQRILGIALTALMVVLIGTGYLLYYVGNEDVRYWSSGAHWVIGIALPMVFIWHYLGPKSRETRPK